MAEEINDQYVALGRVESNNTNINEESSGDSGSLNNRNITRVVHRRASIGSYRSGDCLVRNPVGKSDSANIVPNIIPHYRRASTGSCHDFCKYGRKNEDEEKERKHSRKRIVKPSVNSYFVEIKVSGGPKKDTNRNILSSNLKPSLVTKPYFQEGKISSSSRNGLSGNKTHLPKSKFLVGDKSLSPDPHEIIKREISLPYKKPLNRSLANNKLSEATEKADFQFEKHSSLVKSKPIKLISSNVSDGTRRRNADGKMVASSLALAKKKPMPLVVNMSPKLPLGKKAPVGTRKDGNLRSVSPVKGQNRTRKIEDKQSSNEKIAEKTLHVIKIENEEIVSESNSDDNAIPSSPLSHAKPCHEDIENSNNGTDKSVADNKRESEETEKAKPIKENPDMLLEKSRMVVSEDQNLSSVKIKVRSGKGEDPLSDNESPTKIRFRKAKMIDSGYKERDLWKKHLKKVGGNDDDDTNDLISSEKVVLKQQNVHKKRDDRVLLNNVIEETITKLIVSKKSKVKALVGAFEKVISLQETEPAPHTHSID